MTHLGEFDGGVGEIAPALVLSDKDCSLVHEAVKLASRVSWVRCFDFGPDFVRLSPFVVQILDYQLVLQIEVAVKRHFAGARGLSDCFDAHPSNAPSMEQILRAIEDAVAGLPGPGNCVLQDPRSIFLCSWCLTNSLPIGIRDRYRPVPSCVYRVKLSQAGRTP